MNRNLFACVGVLLLAAASGCAMCDNSQDCMYGTYGGKWQRHDPCCGRVGSLFAPAGARAMPQEAQVTPSQQPDNAQHSVLLPEDFESLDEPLPDIESLDEPSPDADTPDLPPVEVDATPPDATPSDAKPVDAAPLNLEPTDAAVEVEPENAASTDVDSAEADEQPTGQLPDFLDDLGIKPGPVEPLQPLERGGLPPLVPTTDNDQ